MAIGSKLVSAFHGTALHRFVSPARSTGGVQRGAGVGRAGRVSRAAGRLSRAAGPPNRVAVLVRKTAMPDGY